MDVICGDVKSERLIIFKIPLYIRFLFFSIHVSTSLHRFNNLNWPNWVEIKREKFRLWNFIENIFVLKAETFKNIHFIKYRLYSLRARFIRFIPTLVFFRVYFKFFLRINRIKEF